LARLGECLEGGDRDEVSGSGREGWVQCDERVGLKLGEGDVLGVERVVPSQLIGDIPGDSLQDAVAQEPDPQPTDVVEAVWIPATPASRARRCSIASMPGDRSVASTRAPSSAAGMLKAPLPAATSRSRIPGCTSACCRAVRANAVNDEPNAWS
jgi:hypothetical protein